MTNATLAWKAPEMSQNRWANSHSTSREEMRRHLKVIAGLAVETNRKAALAFAARVLDMPYWRVSEIFYGRAHRIDAHEADRIRAFVWQADKLIKARDKLEADRVAFLAEAPAYLAKYLPGPVAIPEIEAEVVPAVGKRGAR